MNLPSPALVLAAAACVGTWLVDAPTQHHVERVVTVALVVVLFEGGRDIGLARFRTAAPVVLSLGVPGTLATALGLGLAVHLVLGTSWYLSLLLATALAPTDPAVVFSVLGNKEIEGRSGTVLEGESGANDPVGIALLVGLLGAGSLGGHVVVSALGTFALQLAVGLLVGSAGGVLMRRVPLLGVPLAFGCFALAVLLDGSGFLAVFVAGIVLGGKPGPYRRLAKAGEVAAFAALGLLVDVRVLGHADVLVPGLLLGVLLAVVVRPLLVAPFLLGSGLRRGERGFIALCGLKGAVPLLLGSKLLPGPEGPRLFGITVVVVLVSVVVQGSAVPTLARVCRVPLTSRDG